MQKPGEAFITKWRGDFFAQQVLIGLTMSRPTFLSPNYKVVTDYPFCKRIKEKLATGEFTVPGDQWPIFLYASYKYDENDPWQGLLRSSLVVKVGNNFRSIFCCFSHVQLIYSRLSSTFLLRLALSTKKRRRRDREMLVFMAWLEWPQHLLHMLLHRYFLLHS